MRSGRSFTVIFCLMSSLFVGTAASTVQAEPCVEGEPGCIPALPPNSPPLEMSIDTTKVDLDARQLEVRLNRPAGKVELKVYGESGAMLAEVSQSFAGRSAGTALIVTWSPSSSEPVAKIEVYGYDKYGYYKGIAIIPWSLSIPHEEVVFETNSAVVRASEEPKLLASLTLIRTALDEHKDLGRITLFIAGHTDTRGQPQHNLELSRNRARAISAWFKARGLGVPIAYEGFGETVLKIKTADEVDEAQNRRVDYVLAVEAPRMKTGGVPAWKQI